MLIIGDLTEDNFCERLTTQLTSLNDEPADFFPLEETRFTDGEYKIRITGGYDKPSGTYKEADELIRRIRSGEKVTFIARGRSGEHFNPERIFVKTLFALGALKTYGAHQDNICAVLPYYVFSRQHEIYREGEAHSAKIVRKAIKDQLAGIVITISAHNYRHEGEMDNRVWNMDATESVIEFARGIPMNEETYIVTPDSGQYSGKLRFPLASALNAGTIAFGKERDRIKGDIDVDVRNLEGLENPQSADIVIYDDEISTGSTLWQDIRMCLSHGIKPEKIHVLVVHNKNAYNTQHGKRGADLIAQTGVNLGASDTIYSEYVKFSIVPQLARYIKKRFW